MAGEASYRFLAVWVLALSVNIENVESSQEVMQKMSKTFFKTINECKEELSMTGDVLPDLVKFWRDDAGTGPRELGCLILCVATKQDLIHLEEYKMHHENAYNFAKDHGADDTMAKTIVKIVHDCEAQFTSDDHCAGMLQVAKCFRDQIHQLNWAPSVEVLVEELLADG